MNCGHQTIYCVDCRRALVVFYDLPGAFTTDRDSPEEVSASVEAFKRGSYLVQAAGPEALRLHQIARPDCPASDFTYGIGYPRRGGEGEHYSTPLQLISPPPPKRPE